MQTLDPQVYDSLMLVSEKSFADIIKLGEKIEDGINNGTIIDWGALQAASKTLQPDRFTENENLKDVNVVLTTEGSKAPLSYHTPPFQYRMPQFQSPALTYNHPMSFYNSSTYPVHNAQPAHFQFPPPTLQRPPFYQNPSNRQSYQPTRPRANSSKHFTPLGEPITQLYERLKVVGYITPVPAIAMGTHATWLDHTKVCDYHSGIKGHTTEECRTLKDKIQALIDTKVIHPN